MTEAPAEGQRGEGAELTGSLGPPPRGVLTVVVCAAVIFAVTALARYETFHNETFDLAFYARMAWGFVRGSFWDPIIGAHIFGLHISPILAPLGVLGRFFGTVESLLVVQGAVVAAAAWPIARIAHRRVGRAAMWWTLLGFLLYPNIFPVVSGEFHPGTLALFPLAWALDATDRGAVRELAWAVGLTLLCREDLALITACIAMLFAHLHPEERARARYLGGISLVYIALFFLVIHPLFAPEEGSLEAHFGPWGDSLVDVAFHILSSPIEVITHTFSPAKLGYLAVVLLPLTALPLLAPRWLAVSTPVFAINLLSHFPAASRLEDHYLTPAVPVLFVAAIHGYARLRAKVDGKGTQWARAGRALPVLVIGAGLGAALWSQASIVSFAAFQSDARSTWANEMVQEVRPDEQVQAPDELLPHLADRLLLHRAPPPDRGADVVILSIAHRGSFVGDESLIRTLEEPLVRNWLAKEGYGLVLANDAYLFFRRGADPRGGPAARFLLGEGRQRGHRIASCLEVLRAERLGAADSSVEGDQGRVRIEFAARGPCPHDLVLRLGQGYRPSRVEPLFEGLLSPSRLRDGDRAFSEHSLPAGFEGVELRVGALRTSGARPEHADPVAVTVTLGQRPSASGD